MAIKPNIKILNSISKRALYYATQMIAIANTRADKEKGDPKIGGHPAASSSALHILGALHLYVKSGFDHMAVKPHASPADHSYNYLLDLLLENDLSKMSDDRSHQAMFGLRAYPKDGEPVFQSYHSAYDPDHHNFFPSGTVGIPPVNAGYLALAYRYAKDHGYAVPENAHFWCVIGDSEFREGSLYEALPDFAEREIGNLTWIVDYNRQSLDGHRITNKKIMDGTDDLRIMRTAEANGWEVINVKHGALRKKLFATENGKLFETFLDSKLEDYEFQALLLLKDPKELKKALLKYESQLKPFLNTVSDEDLFLAFRDLGGHDFESLIEAMELSKKNARRPTLIIAHTIKGWGLRNAAAPGNHSSLPSSEEIDALRESQGISKERLFEKFDSSTPEAKYLKERGEKLYSEIKAQNKLKEKNKKYFVETFEKSGEFPISLDINFKMANYPHTQWMLGQLTAKLTRIANTALDKKNLKENQKELSETERLLKVPAELLVSMAPDVGTSTNLNPAMDGKVFGAEVTRDYELELDVKDHKLPDLVPGEDNSDRFLRFEIAEGNVMSCMGSFGRLRDLLGIPIMPLMTVYDFFVKRALDQFFYNLYWKSSFILVGTPSGVTLSPEGAQHGWKSDIQIPNQVTWEPFYCQELDWIFCHTLKNHFYFDNKEQSGTFIRGTTRGVDQKEFLNRLKRHKTYKKNVNGHLLNLGQETYETMSEADILKNVRKDVLQGGYYLIDYRGYEGYEPGDNVVNIFAMGSLGTEAIIASDKLLERGIFANVIIVTSPDLLIGNLAKENDYYHLKHSLNIHSQLFLRPVESTADVITLAGRRIPIVSVHDGEPGLLDNIGSIIGVRHECLAVRKHSKCGRPSDVYTLHGIDADAIVDACGLVLSETALEQIQIPQSVFAGIETHTPVQVQNWRELWPQQSKD